MHGNTTGNPVPSTQGYLLSCFSRITNPKFGCSMPGIPHSANRRKAEVVALRLRQTCSSHQKAPSWTGLATAYGTRFGSSRCTDAIASSRSVETVTQRLTLLVHDSTGCHIGLHDTNLSHQVESWLQTKSHRSTATAASRKGSRRCLKQSSGEEGEGVGNGVDGGQMWKWTSLLPAASARHFCGFLHQVCVSEPSSRLSQLEVWDSWRSVTEDGHSSES